MDEVMQSYVQELLKLREKEQEIRKTKEEQLAREKEQDKTLWLAYHDGLTGLYNRMGFSRRCEEEGFEKSDFDISHVILLALDVNDLKIANDHYGHDVGDELIRHVAKTLVRCMETQDIFRMGGDEFLVYLRDVTDEEAERRLEAFQKTVRDSNASIPFPVVVSCGVARGQPTQSMGDLQHTADLRMYAEKRRIKEQAYVVQTKKPEKAYRAKSYVKPDGLWETVGSVYLFLFVIILVLIL